MLNLCGGQPLLLFELAGISRARFNPMWKRMPASVGVSAAALSFGILIAVLGTPVRSDSAFPQKFSVVGDKTQGFVDELLARMMAHRRWQDSALREYQAHRLFYATNQRFNIDSTLE